MNSSWNSQNAEQSPFTETLARNPRSMVPTLVAGILGVDNVRRRRAIAKAITLLESTRADHRVEADVMLASLLPHTGRAFRLGLSGVPGVGKSTLIEALGLYLIEQGLRVAVLTIDPSSTVSGGSILGDKTRMEKLSVHERPTSAPAPVAVRWAAWPRKRGRRCWCAKRPVMTS